MWASTGEPWVHANARRSHSLLLLGAKLGMEVRVGCPNGYRPDESVRKRAAELATEAGGSVMLTDDPAAAVRNADAVYTDVWTSMGDEDEAKELALVVIEHRPDSNNLKTILGIETESEDTEEVADEGSE